MKILRTMFAAAVGASVLLTGCSTGQPHPGCYMQSASSWFFALNRTAATDATCSAAQLAINGERVGVFKYRTPGEKDARLVFRPTRTATGTAADPTNEAAFQGANAIGAHAEEPGDDRFCAVEQMNPAEAALASGGTRRYEFTDVRTYAGARSLGQQLVAKLKITEPGPTAGTTCVMDFDVQGIWPRIPCDPTIEPGSAAAAEAPLDTCGPGSGVNADIEFRCVPASATVGFCAPKNATPSYKPGIEEIDYAD